MRRHKLDTKFHTDDPQVLGATVKQKCIRRGYLAPSICASLP